MDASSDYYDSSDFKRDRRTENDEESFDGGNLKNSEYIKELIKERNNLDSDSHASRLLDLGNYDFSGDLSTQNICENIDFFFSSHFTQKYRMQRQAASLFGEINDMWMFIARNKSELSSKS